MLINDFAFGYDVGFDIQAKETVNLLNCFADGPSLGVGQVGFKLTQTADLVSMIGGGASGQDIGVYINIPAMPTAGSISISGAQFWGNYAHVISDQHKALNITASYFRDNNGGMRKGVSINDGVTGITNVSSSIFDGPGNPISIATEPRFGRQRYWETVMSMLLRTLKPYAGFRIVAPRMMPPTCSGQHGAHQRRLEEMSLMPQRFHRSQSAPSTCKHLLSPVRRICRSWEAISRCRRGKMSRHPRGYRCPIRGRPVLVPTVPCRRMTCLVA
jgi:hypothetical protein